MTISETSADPYLEVTMVDGRLGLSVDPTLGLAGVEKAIDTALCAIEELAPRLRARLAKGASPALFAGNVVLRKDGKLWVLGALTAEATKAERVVFPLVGCVP